jgi:hypothetical protein
VGLLRDPDANDEPFRILVFAGLDLAGLRVQEESTAPHVRLVYVHLQTSFVIVSARVTAVGKRVKKKCRSGAKKDRIRAHAIQRPRRTIV